jgi:UPF0755 protein
MKTATWTVIKSVALATCLVIAVIGGYSLVSKLPGIINDFSVHSSTETVKPTRDVLVTIPKGASLSQVASILYQEEVISNQLLFKLVAWLRGEQRNVKAGDYGLKTGMDPGDVMDLLISGKTLVLNFTVPEGYNIYQVADLFQQTGVMSRESFLNLAQDKSFIKELGVDGLSLEGYLFPDTYSYRPSEKGDGKAIVRRMVQRFKDVYDKQVGTIAETNGWTTLQVVTLASLIEKEAKESEHTMVSAVFHNRLKNNMKLQSDPTVIYGLKPMGAKITRADLDRKQPYNTYQYLGLPPGPIANPGKASLIASVKPAEVDYLYFVSKNDGSHQFSSTLQEHNRWVLMYQKQTRN